MKPKNVLRGIKTAFLSGLLAYTLSAGNMKAQNNPSQVMDSTVVEKEILFDVHIYDETTGLPVEKAAADISGKLFDGDFYSGFETEDVYTFEGPISTDVNGNFSGGMILRTFQLVGVRDRQPLAPTGYALSNSWPEPFDNHSSLKVLTKERELADLVVYNILGQEVFRKKDLDLSAGVNTFIFKGLDNLPSGMYLFTAEGDGFVMAENGMKVDGFSGTSKGRSLSKSYDDRGISVEKVSSEAYNSSSFHANKSTAKNLEQEVSSGRFVEDVLAKQGVNKVSDDHPFYGFVYDTVGITWIKNPGYHANSVIAIPLNGVLSGKDTIVTYQYGGDSPGFTFNIFSPGENGVDTVSHYYNKGFPSDYPNGFIADDTPATFRGRTFIEYSEKGAVADKLRFVLPAKPK